MPRPREYASAADRQAAYRARVRERENDEARARYEAAQKIPAALDRLRGAIAEAALLHDADAKLLHGLETHEFLSVLARRFEDRAEELRQANRARLTERKRRSSPKVP